MRIMQNKKVSPRMEKVLELIYKKRPLLEYEVVVMNGEGLGEEVVVYQDGFELGRIDAEYRRYSYALGRHNTFYAITCHNIHKSRGNKNTKYCSKPESAARTVIELFEKKSMDELWYELKENIQTAIINLHQNINSHFVGAFNFSHRDLAFYFTALHTGANPKMPFDLEKQIVSKDILRKKDNLDIADNVFNHMKNNNGYVLQIMKDGSLLCADLREIGGINKYQSTYDLAPFLQEKFTMLKLLDQNQFVADIGVWYEREYKGQLEKIFFIVAGETKVM